MALMTVDKDAPVLDRLVTVRFADPGYYDNFGDWQEQTRDEIMWAARVDLRVDVISTRSGAVEVGGAIYVIRWLDVRFGHPAETVQIGAVLHTADARPAIVGLKDSVGYRKVIGVENLEGYRGRYLEIHCAGTR